MKRKKEKKTNLHPHHGDNSDVQSDHDDESTSPVRTRSDEEDDDIGDGMDEGEGEDLGGDSRRRRCGR